MKLLLTAAAAAVAIALAGAAPPAATAASAHRAVIGGVAANSVQWGFTVGVFGANELCTGVVIAPTKVLTAGHCGLRPPLSVVANRPFLRNTSVGEEIPVTSVAVHPSFTLNGQHDLSILTLSQATTAPPIQLTSAAEDAAATSAAATLRFAGFGERNPLVVGRSRAGALAAIQLTVRPGCSRLYRRAFDPALDICALGRHFRTIPLSRSACFGDSGGPLVADTPAGPRLVGIASFISSVGKGSVRQFVACGFRKLPNVFARVSADLPFIQQNLSPPA